MQSAYVNKLSELLEQDPRFMVVLSDSGSDYDRVMSTRFERQYVNVGIAEQEQLGLAAGLALSGRIPFVFTNGSFLVYRGYEFLRDDICLQGVNVKMVGFGSGLSIPSLGPTHHTTEDLAILRSLPQLTVFAPATPEAVRRAVAAAAETEGPCYLRIEMTGEPESEAPADIDGTGVTLIKDGKDVLILTLGSMWIEGRRAAEELEKDGISAAVYALERIKPVPAEALASLFCRFPLIVTAEEHQKTGGIGSLSLEILAENRLPAALIKVGLDDAFASGYGTREELRRANGLSADQIVERIRKERGK